MKKTIKKAFGIFLFPIIMVGAIHLSNDVGSIIGSGSSKNGDVFPVIAQEFNIHISDEISDGRTIEVSIPVKKITTENWMRDKHMQMAIFDNEFPNIVFRANTLLPIQPGNIELDGTLTINGKDRKHQLDLLLETVNSGITIKGNTQISLKEYGIKAPGMGPMKVFDLVLIDFDLKILDSQIIS